MSKFIDKVKEIKKENEKIAIFVDMDGTIAEYPVYQEENVAKAMEEEYSKIEPVNYIINILKELSSLGPKIVIITSVTLNNLYGAYLYDKQNNEYYFYFILLIVSSFMVF